MFWTKNKKISIHCIPQFYFIKVGFKGVFIARTCISDDFLIPGLIKLQNHASNVLPEVSEEDGVYQCQGRTAGSAETYGRQLHCV